VDIEVGRDSGECRLTHNISHLHSMPHIQYRLILVLDTSVPVWILYHMVTLFNKAY
jgi:hypothetical protein